jgi:AcrR family transcriptional regulator
MARHPQRRPANPAGNGPEAGEPPSGGAGVRGRIIDAFMALLADKPFEQIGLAEIAQRAGVSLADLRGEFSSSFAILAAQIKEIDQRVLSADMSDMAEEPVRDRLFDIIMRRFEALAPYRAALRSLMRSGLRNPPLGLALNCLTARSQQWMLAAAGIDTSGARGALRAQGMALLYARVLWIFIEDEDPGLARTMAALDRELARGARWAGFVDDLCLIPQALGRIGRLGGWRARRHMRPGEEEAAA